MTSRSENGPGDSSDIPSKVNSRGEQRKANGERPKSDESESQLFLNGKIDDEARESLNVEVNILIDGKKLESLNDEVNKFYDSDEDRIAPDGGWGWIILIGSIYITIMVTSACMCFSIEFGEKMKSFNMSSTTISWIFNINSVVWNVATPMVGPLCKMLGYREIAFTLSFMASLCYIALAFATSPIFLFIFYTLYGVFGGMSQSLNTIILGAYFDKRRGFAICLNFASGPLGFAIMPRVIRSLQNEYGYFGATLIHGALFLNGCVAAALYDPVEQHQKKRRNIIRLSYNDQQRRDEGEEIHTIKMSRVEKLLRTSSAQLKLKYSGKQNSTSHKKNKNAYEICKKVMKEVISNWKNCLVFFKSYRVLINGFAFGFLLMGYVNFAMLTPFAMVSTEKYSYEDAANALACAGGANFMGRLSMAFLSDRKWVNNKIVYMSGSLIATLFCILFMFALADLAWLLACMTAWGFGVGLSVSVWVILLIESVGIDDYIPALGTCGLIMAGSYITIGPLLGMLRDYSSSYTLSLSVCALAQVTAATLWLFMPIAKELDHKKQLNKQINKTKPGKDGKQIDQ